MRAFEFGYGPNVIELRQGEQVRIVVENGGEILHNLKIGGLAADAIESRNEGGPQADEGELLVWVREGEQGTLVFTPRASGAFSFYCTIRGHREQGMEGIVTVAPLAGRDAGGGAVTFVSDVY